MTELNIYQQYNKLKDEIADLENKAKILKQERDGFEVAIIEDMQSRGEESVKRDGYLYIVEVEKHWPKVTDPTKMVQWFIDNDLKEKLGVHAKTLGSFIKETQEVPLGVEVSEHVDLKRRKAK